MRRPRDAFDDLRALVHRCAHERKGELQALAGDAENTHRFLGVMLDIYDAAVDQLRQRAVPQPDDEAGLDSHEADASDYAPDTSSLDDERQRRADLVCGLLDEILNQQGSVVGSVDALNGVLSHVEQGCVVEAMEAYVEGLECIIDARALFAEVGAGTTPGENPDADTFNSECEHADDGAELEPEVVSRLEQDQADAEEIWQRGIAERGGSIGPEHYRRLKFERALETGPLPDDTLREPPSLPAKVRHLTRNELVRVHELGCACVGRYHESTFVLFIAEVLPRFKDAASKRQNTIPMWPQDWQNAAMAAGAAASAVEPLLSATNLFVRVKEQGTYGGERFAPEWKLREGVFTFDDDAPKKSEYLRSAQPERKWYSFQTALAGGDGRAVK